MEISNGLVEQHIHGAFGIDFMNCSVDDFLECSALLASFGVTAYFPTIMTVEPGFGGQKFMQDCADKIKEVKAISKDVIVEVDGGINNITAEYCRNIGVDAMVAGNYVFSSDDMKEAIASLR